MTEKEYLKTLDDLGYVTWMAYEGDSISGDTRIIWEGINKRWKKSWIRTGQTAAVYGLSPLNNRRGELIHKKNHEGGLSPIEEALLEELQQIHSACIDRIHPHAPTIEFSNHIKTLMKAAGIE